MSSSPSDDALLRRFRPRSRRLARGYACARLENAGVPRRRRRGVQHLVQHGTEARGDDLMALSDAKPRLALCHHLDALCHHPQAPAQAPPSGAALQPAFLCSDRTPRAAARVPLLRPHPTPASATPSALATPATTKNPATSSHPLAARRQERRHPPRSPVAVPLGPLLGYLASRSPVVVPLGPSLDYLASAAWTPAPSGGEWPAVESGNG
ncbi:uncharacterized protein [Triticum aestivum]|uniref:uncharacterized protein isoform X2 n=1 Tax=Triticum aestivum TaxID=4565 RepID=UPI001D022732|nr:uncharacterized protein LOC123158863 isoform X2 [Triticum aestivum]